MRWHPCFTSCTWFSDACTPCSPGMFLRGGSGRAGKRAEGWADLHGPNLPTHFLASGKDMDPIARSLTHAASKNGPSMTNKSDNSQLDSCKYLQVGAFLGFISHVLSWEAPVTHTHAVLSQRAAPGSLWWNISTGFLIAVNGSAGKRSNKQHVVSCC